MGAITTLFQEQVLAQPVQTWSECSPDSQLTRLPRLATAWSPHPGASPFLLPILRGTWSTFPPECAPLTGLQSVCWSFLRNGSPPCTPRLVSVGPTWPSADLPPSSAPRSTLSWSMTSMLDLVSSLSWLVWLSRLALTGLPPLTRLLMKMKLLRRASDRARLILARLLLPMRNQSRPTPQPGRTSFLPRRRLSVSSWRESTGPGSSLPTLRLRKGWTTSSRQPTWRGAWSRSTWWTGSLATSRTPSPLPRKTQL